MELRISATLPINDTEFTSSYSLFNWSTLRSASILCLIKEYKSVEILKLSEKIQALDFFFSWCFYFFFGKILSYRVLQFFPPRKNFLPLASKALISKNFRFFLLFCTRFRELDLEEKVFVWFCGFFINFEQECQNRPDCQNLENSMSA